MKAMIKALLRPIIVGNEGYRYIRLIQSCIGFIFESLLWLLGPCLICTVTAIVTGELYVFFAVLVRFHAEPYTPLWWLNSTFAVFLAVNISWNYALCVCTNAGTHDSAVYKELVSEARATGQLGRQSGSKQREGNQVPLQDATVVQRSLRSSATNEAHLRSNNASEAVSSGAVASTPVPSWLDQGALEWGHCRRTNQPKAPRAHYDHVTKKLVLNMDHYCPWMFNVVGYMNYRYFFLFLGYVLLACVYGLFLTAVPFVEQVRRNHAQGVRGVRGRRFSAESALSYTFVLALSMGIAVGLLFFWHVYLVLTGQTTIEFYGNQTKAYRARLRGLAYRNPYDAGSALANWQRVFGKQHPLIAVLPSRRPPHCRPWLEHSDATSSAINNEHIV